MTASTVTPAPACHDCGREVLCDLIIPCYDWRAISPTADDGGMLCPSCIVERLARLGRCCSGAFMGGPIRSVSEAEMEALRRVENIEIALEGRRNRWGAALDSRIAEGGNAARWGAP